MRGFGVNQTSFAIEGCLDLLARKVGIDGWEIRWRNAVRVGDVFSSGQVLDKSVGLEKTLLAVKDAYYAARDKGVAVGIACGVKNSGIGRDGGDWSFDFYMETKNIAFATHAHSIPKLGG